MCALWYLQKKREHLIDCARQIFLPWLAKHLHDGVSVDRDASAVTLLRQNFYQTALLQAPEGAMHLLSAHTRSCRNCGRVRFVFALICPVTQQDVEDARVPPLAQAMEQFDE